MSGESTEPVSNSSASEGGALLDVLHEVYSSLSSSHRPDSEDTMTNKWTVDSLSSPPSPTATAAAETLLRASKRTRSESAFMDHSLSFYLGEADDVKKGGCEGLENKQAHTESTRDYSHVSFPAEADFAFATAVFEIGLRQSSPKIIMSLMDPPLEANLTTEHIKSHLQKFRQNYNKSNEEFVEYYSTHLKHPFAEFLRDGTYARLINERAAAVNCVSDESTSAGDSSATTRKDRPLSPSSGLPLRAEDLLGADPSSSSSFSNHRPSDGRNEDPAALLDAAEAEAAKAASEMEMYRGLVKAILDDEREMASLQRIQFDLMTQHMETQSKLQRFLQYQMVLQEELHKTAAAVASPTSVQSSSSSSSGGGGGSAGAAADGPGGREREAGSADGKNSMSRPTSTKRSAGTHSGQNKRSSSGSHSPREVAAPLPPSLWHPPSEGNWGYPQQGQQHHQLQTTQQPQHAHQDQHHQQQGLHHQPQQQQYSLREEAPFHTGQSVVGHSSTSDPGSGLQHQGVASHSLPPLYPETQAPNSFERGGPTLLSVPEAQSASSTDGFDSSTSLSTSRQQSHV